MKPRTTAERILAEYEKRPVRRSNRLGISTLGQECERKLWYEFRWVAPAERHDGQRRRLFDTGHREEARVVEDLRSIGCGVEPVDPETGEQFEFTAPHGHVVGKLDGIVENAPEAPGERLVLEIKTHNEKSFDRLREKGVEKAKPEHFGQCQLGASMAELSGALYVAVHKDTDDIYSELVPLNRKKADALLEKGERIAFSQTVPDRVKNANVEFFPCGWCRHQQLCFYSTSYAPVVPERNCRTCLHSTPERDGSWGCDKHRWVLDKERQETGCESHLFEPSLLPFGDPIEWDFEKDWVLYPGMWVDSGRQLKKGGEE